MAEQKTSLSDLLLGPIKSLEMAKKFRLPSLCLSALSAAFWIIMAVTGLLSPGAYGHWPIVYASVAALLAWGLYKMRKEAAVIALIISLVELLSGSTSLEVVKALVAFLVAVAAIRGTFAYSLLLHKPAVAKGQ